MTRNGQDRRAVLPTQGAFGEAADFQSTILENIETGIWVTDATDTVTYANQAMGRIAGVSAKKLSGLRLLEDFPAETLEHFRPRFLAVQQTRQPARYDNLPVTTPAGRKTYQSGWLIPLTGDDGYRGMICTVEDVTKQKQAEDELAQQRRYLEKAQTIGQIGTWELDLTRNELLWTDENYRIFGLPSGTPLTYEVFLDRVHPEDRDFVHEKWTAGLAGEPYDIEHRLLVDGEVRWVREKAELTFDDQGNALRGTGVTQDITTWKKAMAALRQSQIDFGQLFENSFQGVALHELVVDDAGKPCDYIFVAANAAFEEQTGLVLKDIIGQPVTAVIPGIEQTDFIDIYGRVVQTGEPRVFEQFAEPLGRTFLISAFRSGPNRFATIFQDVTEERLAEERQQQTQRVESLAVLAGGIAHDFNNLLTGILGNVSLARAQVEAGSELRELLDESEENLARARGLANQLLAFSRGGILKKKVLSPEAVIRDATRFANRGSRSQLELSLADKLPKVEADADLLAQVLGNLVINANQAMPGGGQIHVSALESTLERDNPYALEAGRYLKVELTDEGPGIAADHLPRIFDPYFSTKGTGRGLGLATSQSIVIKHGGVLEARNESGGGATFSLLLPATDADANASAGDDGDAQAELPQGRRVLVLDDEPVVRRVLGRILEKLGCRVDGHGVAAPAIEAFGQAVEGSQAYDLCILDLTLPGDMSGLEVARRLRDIQPEAVLLVSSGYSEDDAMNEPAAHGFDGVLPKPYNIEEVRAALFKHLR